METGVESPGKFSFIGLPTGNYQLSVETTPGFAAVTPREITITGETAPLSINIGLLREAASEFVAGDANKDFFFDEADWILAMKGGKFGADVAATWEEGDFDGDGRFDHQDIELARQTGGYDPGGISYGGGDVPEHTRVPLTLDADNATVQIFYLQNTGRFAILSEAELSSFHVYSKSGLFNKTNSDEFDVQSSHSAFWFDPAGWEAKQGLVINSRQDLDLEFLLSDLSVDGTQADGSPLNSVSLSVLVWRRLVQSCFKIRSAGAIVGDANLDGVFDSSDLVRVFQRGEYEDGRDKNSSWHSGDWNCDDEFDSSDIVEAFEQAGFEIDTNAATAVAAVELLTQDMERESDSALAARSRAAIIELSRSFESYTLYSGSSLTLFDASFVTPTEEFRRDLCQTDCARRKASDEIGEFLGDADKHRPL